MAAGSLTVGEEIQAPTTKRRTPTGDAIRQLRKNKMAVAGFFVIVVMVFIAIFVDTRVFTIFTGAEVQPLIARYHYAEVDFIHTNAPAFTRTDEGKFYLLGTDYLGRDNLSRALYGTRISLSVAVIAATVSLVVGVIFGMIAGYGSPAHDNAMMRFVDFLYGFPLIIFIILMQVYFKALSAADTTNPIARWVIEVDQAMGGIFLVFVAIGLVSWLGMARIARGQTLSYKRKEFVEASRSVGSDDGEYSVSTYCPTFLVPALLPKHWRSRAIFCSRPSSLLLVWGPTRRRLVGAS